MAARQVVARLGFEAGVHPQRRLDDVLDRELGDGEVASPPSHCFAP